MARSTQRHVRGWAEYLGGTRVRFHFNDCSHTVIKDYSKGPVSRRMGEAGTKLMASWWTKEKNGVSIPPCARCSREPK